MLKKALLITTLALGAATAAEAQVQNYALTLAPQARVECGTLPQLQGLSSFTVQMWMCPAVWTEGATLFSRGADFKATLSRKGKVDFTIGNATVPATSAELAQGQWAQITLVVKDNKAQAVVNNTPNETLYDVPSLTASDEQFVLGGGTYQGRIDEVRLWADALAPDFEYFTFNTLTKWVPQYDKLVAYYKMDQELCPDLVEYKVLETGSDVNNHGVIVGDATKEPVTDNALMPYLVNSAYTANERFFDRVIPRDQYLLSNDIINLGIQSYPDGHLEYINPCNHATARNGASYLSSDGGREGLLSLDGTGYLSASPTMLDAGSSTYTFETWYKIGEWADGAALCKQETADGLHGLFIGLGTYGEGDAAEKVLVVRVNGNNWRFPKALVDDGQWHHIGVTVQGGTTASTCFTVVKDGTALNAPRAKYLDGGTDVTPSGAEAQNFEVGRKFKGLLDETLVWNRTFGAGDIRNHMNRVPMPSLDGTVTAGILYGHTAAYYAYDDPQNLGWSSHSQDEWLRIMRSAYEGYRGAHFYISVKTPSGNLDSYLGSEAWRNKFAQDLALLIAPYDGAELDLEWTYNWSQYGKLAQKIRETLPEGKKFRISTHNVTYAFPLDKMKYADGFTFQQYGPQANHFKFSDFKNKVSSFISYGFPKEKIMTSYSTTTSNGNGDGQNGRPIMGVKDGFFGPDYEATDADTEWREVDGQKFYFTGPYQTWNRARYTRKMNLQGIFYWDMGNDCWDGPESAPVMSKWNLARWCSYGLAANVDRLVEAVTVNHPEDAAGVAAPLAEGEATAVLRVTDNGAGGIDLYLSNGREIASWQVYSLSGSLQAGRALLPGAYVVTAADTDGNTYSQKFIKK